MRSRFMITNYDQCCVRKCLPLLSERNNWIPRPEIDQNLGYFGLISTSYTKIYIKPWRESNYSQFDSIFTENIISHNNTCKISHNQFDSTQNICKIFYFNMFKEEEFGIYTYNSIISSNNYKNWILRLNHISIYENWFSLQKEKIAFFSFANIVWKYDILRFNFYNCYLKPIMF